MMAATLIWMKRCQKGHRYCQCYCCRISTTTTRNEETNGNLTFRLSSEWLHWKCITWHVHRIDDRLWRRPIYRRISANGILLCSPIVPRRSYNHFFVEIHIFHLHRANHHRIVLLHYHIFQRHILAVQLFSKKMFKQFFLLFDRIQLGWYIAK